MNGRLPVVPGRVPDAPRVRPTKPPPPRSYRVACGGRVVRAVRHETVHVRISVVRYVILLLTRRKNKKTKQKPKIPFAVHWPIPHTEGMKWSSGWWFWPAHLVIVPPAGAEDRWRRSGKAKPHSFWFAPVGARNARMLRIAWVIELAYEQANFGQQLADSLPPMRRVRPTITERLMSLADGRAADPSVQ